MKKFIQSFKATRILFVVAFVLMCGMLYAQGGAPAQPEDADTSFSLLTSLPVWLQTLLAIITIVLPALQAVLKLIPTQSSIRISGWVGKFADLLTFFIKDKRAGGGKFK